MAKPLLALAGAASLALGYKYVSAVSASKAQQKSDVGSATPEDFNKLFAKLLDKFLVYAKKEFDLSKPHMERLRWLFEYTCKGGKCYRASLAISTVKLAAEHKGQAFTKLRAEQAMVLGWCVEVLQACFLVADDIMDASTTRRGQPCWYLQPTIKMDAVNDSLILESFIYFLLNEYFGDNQTLFIKESKLFQKVSLQTQIGQMLDLTSQPQGGKGPEVLKRFNLDLYQKIVKYKTACYTFYLPLASGMLLAGYTDEADYELAREICMELGEKFQIQDDYLDCYGAPEMIGKIGTDIQDHKCSWLCVQALERMSPEQRAKFETVYGNEDEESVAWVKKLFNDLGLEEAFDKQEEESFARIEAKIAQATKTLPDLFTPILKKIHRRQK